MDADAHIAEVDDQGYTIVPDVITRGEAAAIADDLERLERMLGVVPAGNAFEGSHTVRIYNLLAHGECYEQIPIHEHVLPIVEGVLDRGCLVSSLSSVGIDPGERAQPIHADDQLVSLAKPHAPLVCNTMWALTDFTEANGATRIVPGSHRYDHDPVFGEHYDSIAAEMDQGSVLVWHGSLWHGGGANRTDTRRAGIAMNYCAGFVRQQENQQLGLPPGVVAGFPRRLQRLVGYGLYNGLIGHIDKQDPIELLSDHQKGNTDHQSGDSDQRSGKTGTAQAMIWDA